MVAAAGWKPCDTAGWKPALLLVQASPPWEQTRPTFHSPMFSALLYLQYHSIRNRTVMRLKRLRQPKYLLGGIVGGIYFYFYFFRYFFSARARPHGFLAAATPEQTALYESIAALILLTIVLLAWIVPHQRAALAFSEAEVAFLFPAPISRSGLIHYKLLRSQTAL